MIFLTVEVKKKHTMESKLLDSLNDPSWENLLFSNEYRLAERDLRVQLLPPDPNNPNQEVAYALNFTYDSTPVLEDLIAADSTLANADFLSAKSSLKRNLQDAKQPSKSSKKQKPKELTAEEREKKRLEQTRKASHLYRERQKLVVQKMQDQLRQLQQEKDLLEQNNGALWNKIRELENENRRLKDKTRNKAQELRKWKLELVERLADLLKRNATDDELKETLKDFSNATEKVTSLSANYLQELLCLVSVPGMVRDGYFSEDKYAFIEKRNGIHSLQGLAEKMVENVGNTTTEQKERLQKVIMDHYETLLPLEEERKILLAELEIELQKNANGPRSLDVIMGTTSRVEHLRHNLQSEALLWQSSQKKLLECFTVRQQAELLLRTAAVCRGLQQFQGIWEEVQRIANNSSTQ